MTGPAPAAGGGGRSSLARAEQWFAQHKVAVLGTAVAAAALLGFRARAKGTAGGVPAGGAGATVTGPGTGTLDTTATDLFDTLSPILEAQGRQIAALSDQVAGALNPGPTPTPPTPPKPPAPPAPWYVLTGKFKGTRAAAGHPVSYDYLVRTGWLARKGSGYVTTSKFGAGRAGHPVSYEYLRGLGFVRRA